MSNSFNRLLEVVPAEAQKLLTSIVRLHQTEDEPPVHFLWRYQQGSAPSAEQAAFDDALREIGIAIDGHGADGLWSEFGSYLGIGWLQPDLSASLAARPIRERVQRAMASAFIFRRYFDIEPYLTADLPHDSLILDQYPRLTVRFTPKDRLLPLSRDVRLRDAWIAHREHEFQVHPGLRRGFGGTPNAELLAALGALEGAGCRVAIAIDHFRLSGKGTLRRLYEADRWFGMPHTSVALDDPNAIGATLHQRIYDVGPDWTQKAGWRMEFRWTLDGELKSFEAEELPIPRAPEHPAPTICRFVHAIRDVGSRRFIHLDGALHVYESGRYASRYDQADQHRLPKIWADRKVKLFRVDSTSKGWISAEAWQQVVERFFRGNELVLEFFSGRNFAEIYEDEYGHEQPWIATQSSANSKPRGST
jgi:hypothetical protein